MKTIEIKLYKFNELSKDAKQKAIEKLYDINVSFDWWEFTYDDAENIGLQLTGFDIDRNKHATGKFLESGCEVAHKILVEHGETCDTHKLAKNFLSDYDALVEKYSDGKKMNVVAEGNEYDFDNDADELEGEFLSALLEEYADMLQKGYEYQTSEEAIIETINANEYDFTEEGELY